MTSQVRAKKQNKSKTKSKKKGRGKAKKDDSEMEESDDDDEDEKEIGGNDSIGGIVGNLFREKAEVVMEEFDQLFGVSSLAKQQKVEGNDEVGPDFIGSNEVGVVPDNVGSKDVAAPDHVGS